MASLQCCMEEFELFDYLLNCKYSSKYGGKAEGKMKKIKKDCSLTATWTTVTLLACDLRCQNFHFLPNFDTAKQTSWNIDKQNSYDKFRHISGFMVLWLWVVRERMNAARICKKECSIFYKQGKTWRKIFLELPGKASTSDLKLIKSHLHQRFVSIHKNSNIDFFIFP